MIIAVFISIYIIANLYAWSLCMIVDEPDLSNSDRLRMAADGLERGEPTVVWVRRNLPAHSYRNWLIAILRDERGHTAEGAEVLAMGASFRWD